jgi:putative flippase GtrA
MSSKTAEIVRFFITSGVAAVVNIGARIPLGWVMPYSASIVLAYLIGMSTAFVLARAFVFRPQPGNAKAEFFRFALVNVVALAQVLAISLALEAILFPRFGFTWHAATVAHVIGVASPAFTSYYGHKLFSFRTPRRKPVAGEGYGG